RSLSARTRTKARAVMIRHLFLVAAVGLVLAAETPKPEPAKNEAAKELDKLQGKWKLVAMDLDGKVMKTSEGHVITFEKEFMLAYSFDGKDLITKDAIRLDPSKTPKTMDLT